MKKARSRTRELRRLNALLEREIIPPQIFALEPQENEEDPEMANAAIVQFVEDAVARQKIKEADISLPVQDVADFILALENKGKFFAWVDADFVCYLPQCLDGSALQWYSALNRANFTTWNLLKDGLLKTFGRTDIDYDIRGWNANLLPDEDPVSYVTSVIKRMTLSDPGATETSKVTRMWEGLTTHLEGSFVSDFPTTITEFTNRLRDASREQSYQQKAAKEGAVSVSALGPLLARLALTIPDATPFDQKNRNTTTVQLPVVFAAIPHVGLPAYVATAHNNDRDEIQRLRAQVESLQRGQSSSMEQKYNPEPRTFCNYCKRNGHVINECRSRARNDRWQASQNQGGPQRGRNGQNNWRGSNRGFSNRPYPSRNFDNQRNSYQPYPSQNFENRFPSQEGHQLNPQGILQGPPVQNALLN